jgi:hypothetical protein
MTFCVQNPNLRRSILQVLRADPIERDEKIRPGYEATAHDLTKANDLQPADPCAIAIIGALDSQALC